MQERTAAEEHLGLLGPTIRAEVGDEIHVVFRNRIRFPAGIHSHGVLYNKSSEGSPYDDGTSGEPSLRGWPSVLCCGEIDDDLTALWEQRKKVNKNVGGLTSR